MSTAEQSQAHEDLKSRIARIQAGLQQGLVERITPVRLALLAALSGEHVLLLGPPGTAKSEVARRIHMGFSGTTYFERLLTRFSVPEELFGPLSLKALEQDRYERLLDGYLPTAGVAFIDEIFKANSAILNSLLTLLNEREFDNGNRRVKTPLVTVIGASNELPEGPELAALFDRFLLRYEVGPVSEGGFTALLQSITDAPKLAPADRISVADLAQIVEGQKSVDVPAEVLELLSAARQHQTQQGNYVSDRRWKKILKLLRTAAYTDGRAAVQTWDCWILEHCLWNKPEDRTKVQEWFRTRIGTAGAAGGASTMSFLVGQTAPVGDPLNPDPLRKQVEALRDLVQKEAARTEQATDSSGQPLWTGPDLKPTTFKQVQGVRDGQLLWINPSNPTVGVTHAELRNLIGMGRADVAVQDPRNRFPVTLPPYAVPARYSKHHILGRATECRDLVYGLLSQLDSVLRSKQSLEAALSSSLWTDPATAAAMSKALDRQFKKSSRAAQDLLRLFHQVVALPCSDGVMMPASVVMKSLPKTATTAAIAVEDEAKLIANLPNFATRAGT